MSPELIATVTLGSLGAAAFFKDARMKGAALVALTIALAGYWYGVTRDPEVITEIGVQASADAVADANEAAGAITDALNGAAPTTTTIPK